MMKPLFMNASFHPFPHLYLAFKADGVTSFAAPVPIAHFLSCHWGTGPGRTAHKKPLAYNCSVPCAAYKQPNALNKEPIQAGDP